jgi:hypothetical protein
MPRHTVNHPTVPRVLLSLSALLLSAGGVLHARAFNGALGVLTDSPMPSFYSGSFKALWLIDSATLVSLGALLIYVVVRPDSVTRPVVYFLALIPIGTAALIYTFVGSFLPAHVFVTAAILMLVAGSLWRPSTFMKSDVA